MQNNKTIPVFCQDALDLYLQLHTKFSELNSSYAELIGPGNSKEEVRLNDALNKIYEELCRSLLICQSCRPSVCLTTIIPSCSFR